MACMSATVRCSAATSASSEFALKPRFAGVVVAGVAVGAAGAALGSSGLGQPFGSASQHLKGRSGAPLPGGPLLAGAGPEGAAPLGDVLLRERALELHVALRVHAVGVQLEELGREGGRGWAAAGAPGVAAGVAAGRAAPAPVTCTVAVPSALKVVCRGICERSNVLKQLSGYCISELGTLFHRTTRISGYRSRV